MTAAQLNDEREIHEKYEAAHLVLTDTKAGQRGRGGDDSWVSKKLGGTIACRDRALKVVSGKMDACILCNCDQHATV